MGNFSRIQKLPAGVGVRVAPTPIIDLQISFPSRYRLARSRERLTTNLVCETYSGPSADAGTQPTVPFGRLGTPILTHFLREAFCRESSLERLFGREGTPLFQNWSGLSAVQFTADAVDRVHKALEKYRTAHPAAVPGFTDGEWPPSDGVTDPILARLVWLDYWMSWAVQKCEKPSIQFG